VNFPDQGSADDPPDASRGALAVQDSAASKSMLNFIAMAVERPDIDVEKLRALLDMQRGLLDDDAKAQFNRDFIAMQAVLPRIKKNGTLEYPVNKNDPDGPKRFVSNFAKWEDIDAGIRPVLGEHGFALSFSTTPRPGDGGGMFVTAILRHRAGHATETSIPVPLDTSGGKNNMQGYGSSLSYGKKYASFAALNIITEGEDDDGVRGGMEFITAEQVQELNDAIRDTGADFTNFCDTMGVRGLTEIQVPAFIVAKNLLAAKKASREKRAKEPAP
jgi:ERF superfamily protein